MHQIYIRATPEEIWSAITTPITGDLKSLLETGKPLSG
jgi:hypothetical protein